jgi:2-polyprenyl-6-methoxyphenol hydroxylase-like FAD-dependent oxidoreductase
MPDVVVIGAGPVGTLLSAELVRRGVDVAVVERRRDPAAGSRAIGVHSPVLAALEASGVTERLLANALRVSAGEARSGGALLGVVRFDRLSRRFPFVATLPQSASRAALAVDAPTPVVGEVESVHANPPRVVYRDDRGRHELAARVVVIAAGPRSRGLLYGPAGVRVQRYPDRFVMADIPADEGADAVVHLDRSGVLESFPLPGGIRRFVAPAPSDATDAAGRATVLRAALHARGLHAEASAVDGAEGFEIRRSLARRLRRGPVLAIGDLAHEVSPMGGQGMNLGLLDAVTLAPLLATWIRAGEPPEDDLRRWERRRLASARISGVIATGNTLLGRPAGAAANALRAGALRAALTTPAGALLAHAYAMGFDRDA